MKINNFIHFACSVMILACGEAAASDTITLHDVTFEEVTARTGLEALNPGSANLYIPTDWTTEGNLGSRGNTMQGLYMEAGSGLKFNGTGGTITVSYLYLDSSIKVAGNRTGSSVNTGEVSWGNVSPTTSFSISSAVGSWLDINQDYGRNISTAKMNGGTVYLNGLGHLNSSLGRGNTLVATAVTARSTLDDNSPLFQLNEIAGSDYTLVTRVLMTGDFSTWGAEDLASVQLEGYSYSAGLAYATSYTVADLTKYYVTADSEGLRVSYLIPEPAAATLSLLALAGLAARRRRQ